MVNNQTTHKQVQIPQSQILATDITVYIYLMKNIKHGVEFITYKCYQYVQHKSILIVRSMDLKITIRAQQKSAQQGNDRYMSSVASTNTSLRHPGDENFSKPFKHLGRTSRKF